METLDTDIVVVAAGTAGLPAAVAAAEGGARVIVFEKTGRAGGCGNMASGLFAVESRLQRQMQLPLTREDVFKYYMNYTHWRVDARLVKAFINKSASTIDWLEKMGVEFRAVESHGPGNHYTWHIIKSDRQMGSGTDMMKILTDRASELGVQLLFKTPVKKILKNDGKVTGVLAEDEVGEEIQTNAKAVIIATGGFGDNPEWVKQYTGFELGSDLMAFRFPGLIGDGLRMAWEAGAAKSSMIMHSMSSMSMSGLSKLKKMVHAVPATFLQPNLMVNLHGERFINEDVVTSNNMFTGNAIALQKNKCAFSMLDENTKQYFMENDFDFETGYGVSMRDPVTRAAGFDAVMEEAASKEVDGFYTASSLEDLADKTGINLKGLQLTLAEYNKACETGRDEMFNRNPRYLRPVKQPRFYAMKFVIGGFGTLGGIKINYNTEVLDKDGEVIPGLYAAGADAEAIYGDTYPITMPGSTMGFAVNSGRMAGENALEYVKSIAT